MTLVQRFGLFFVILTTFEYFNPEIGEVNEAINQIGWVIGSLMFLMPSPEDFRLRPKAK